MRISFKSSVLCAMPMLFASATAHAVCHVTTEGQAGNSGIDWSESMDLQAALGTPSCTEIWVARGVYKPAATGLREGTFQVVGGQALYGGFDGTELLRDERDWVANPTVLSGDIDDNDPVDASGVLADAAQIVGTNSIHVVTMRGRLDPIVRDTVLDGFTVTAGTATGTAPPDGGGLYCDSCSPTLRNLVFSGNNATRGGGMFIQGQFAVASPAFENVVFRGNSAANGGGLVIHARDGSSIPSFRGVSFIANRASEWGGGMWVFANSHVTLNDCTFSGNMAKRGGALYSEGTGSENGAGLTDLVIANCTFDGNSAIDRGGAVFATGSGSTWPGASNLLFENVTLTANTAGDLGSAMYSLYNAGLTQTFRNVIVWGNGEPGDPISWVMDLSGASTMDFMITQSECAICTNSTTADPMLGPLTDNGGPVQTRLPDAVGSAVDNGDDTVCAGANVGGVDARGIDRPQGSRCDIGAVEWSTADIPQIIFQSGFESEVSTRRQE